MLSRGKSWGALVAVAVISLMWSFVSHRFQPSVEIDSSSYTAFDWSTAQSVLSNQRTFGYPLFYALANRLALAPQYIPLLHWLALICSAFLVLEGLVSSGYRRSTAVWSAGVLMFGRSFMDQGRSITADSLACSLAIAATGCFLATSAVRPSRLSWLGLMLLTFLSYQTRPAYLFLIPLWPVLSLCCDRFILHRESPWKTSLRRCATYGAIVVIPFVTFCTLRWAVVGHWGLVSFGGYNIIGVAGQFLDQNSVDAMPDELRPVAQAIFDRKSQLANAETPQNFEAMERMYNPTIWEVAVPVVRELHGENPLVVNRILSQLSGELMRQHSRQYGKWLVWNGIHAVKQVVQLTMNDTGTRLLAIILLVSHAFSLLRGPSVRAQPDSPNRMQLQIPRSHASPQQMFLELHLLFWIAVGFAAAKGLLVILVEPANDRYMSGAMPLLPAAIAVFVAQYFESKPESN